MIPVIPSTVEESSPAGDAVSTRQQHAAQLDTSEHVHQAVGVKRCAEVNPMFSSAKRAHAIHPPVPQILSQLRGEMEMMPVPEDSVEAQPDVEMGTESVRSGTKRASSTWEDCADKINMEVTAAHVMLTKFWRQLPESDQNPNSCKSAKCSSGVADTKGHPCRKSSARGCPTKPRETKPSQEL